MDKKQRVLILGASGMLGHKMFETFRKHSEYEVYGTVTSLKSFNNCLPNEYIPSVIEGVVADDISSVKHVLNAVKPDVIINCIGIIKQKKDANMQFQNILLNALFPQQVNALCEKYGIRFITVATDCVYDGKKGSAYLESDPPTCHDIYGMSKYLGEIHSGPNLTLRTSIIGHELKAGISLLDWFLSQENKSIKGFEKAIFSGFPTVVLARFIAERIIPNSDLNGLYHISTNPISKLELLTTIKDVYGKNIKIVPDNTVDINRSLNSDILREKTNYSPPSWRELVQEMYEDYLVSPFYKSKRKI